MKATPDKRNEWWNKTVKVTNRKCYDIGKAVRNSEKETKKSATIDDDEEDYQLGEEEGENLDDDDENHQLDEENLDDDEYAFESSDDELQNRFALINNDDLYDDEQNDDARDKAEDEKEEAEKDEN